MKLFIHSKHHACTDCAKNYIVNLKSLLTFRIKNNTQTFKPNTNFIAMERITTIIMIDNGATIRIFSITFNTGKLSENEE